MKSAAPRAANLRSGKDGRRFFSNCRDEWWHYSYGDAGWAVRLGFPECIYGEVGLDPHLFEEQERLWLEAFKERKNPFLPSDPS